MTIHELLEIIRARLADVAAKKFSGETAIRVHWSQGGIGRVQEERKEVLK